MCLIVSGKENKFIAKKDIIVYKKLEQSGFERYVTFYQKFPVKLNSLLVPEGDFMLEPYGSKYQIGEGVIHAYTKIPESGIYFEAIIEKGTKFWIQDDLSEVAAESLFLTDVKVIGNKEKQSNIFNCIEGVDVYLKDGRRCKVTDNYDKKDVLGIYGYDNQVIALEYKNLQLFKDTLSDTNGFKKIESESDNIVEKLTNDLDGYGNTKQLKSLGIKSEALDYYEELGKDWYIPSSGELKKLFKNMVRINITLHYLGKPMIDFSWFWSSTLESSEYAWGCDSGGDGGWYSGGFGYGCVDDHDCVLPFLELS